MFSTEVLFFCFQIDNARFWDYFVSFYLMYMLLLFPGFPPHFAMGYLQDYKVNSLKCSKSYMSRRITTVLPQGHLSMMGILRLFSVRPALQPA